MSSSTTDRNHLNNASGKLTEAFILIEEGWHFGTLTYERGKVTRIDATAVAELPGNESAACYVLPGIVDIHGDAFERHITPRAGTEFPLDLAFAANDHALVGAGITSFFYSITDGFEPGPRSRDTARSIVQTIQAMRPTLRCDSYLHIRHEEVNTWGHNELMKWIKERQIDLLSLNNHLPFPDDERTIERYTAGLTRRLKMTLEESREIIASLQHHREQGAIQVEELSVTANACEIPLASHDDADQAAVKKSIDRGVAVAEFPMTLPLAKELRDAGISVLMGAPNLVRGGSHIGGLCVKEAVENRQIDALCSDYYYPSLFNAPFMLEKMQLLSLPKAWQLVSENPAQAVGLGHRKGKVAPQFDADLLVLNRLDGNPLSIQKVIARGNTVLNRGNATLDLEITA